MENQLPPPVIKVVKQAGYVKIHTFISPEAFLANATHIIEGPTELVIIDGQFVVPFAMGFRAYADSLGKKINRVYLSHEHPDHFFGISAAFRDVPVYALQETIDFLKEHGEEIRKSRAAVYGGFVPASLVMPTHVAKAGKEVIDGVTYEVEILMDGEVKTQMGIGLPDLHTYVIQDLVYSGGHIYIHDLKDTVGWIGILERLVDSNYTTFLPGHGDVADKKELRANIAYLKKAVKIAKASTDFESYKAAILAAFPKRSGAAIIDIYGPNLFTGHAH